MVISPSDVIPISDLPVASSGRFDSLIGVDESQNEAVKFSVDSLPTPSSTQAQIDSIVDGQQTSAIYSKTLNDLQSVTGSYVGQGAFVTNGNGAGQYRWNGASWEFLRADSISEIRNEISNLPSALETLSSWSASEINRQPGYVINKDTGVVSVSANFWYAWAPLNGSEVSVRVTASLSQPIQALAVYKDENGVYLGYEFPGTTTETLYTNYVLKNIPPLARSVHVSSRRNNISIDKRLIQEDAVNRISTAESSIENIQLNLGPIRTTLSEWISQDATSVTGAYVDKTTGAQVSSSAYNYKYISVNGSEGHIQFTTYVTGTTVAPVVFYNESNSVISNYGNVATQYTNQTIPIPVNARRVAVTARDGNPIDIRLQSLAENISTRLRSLEQASTPSRWEGTASASFGDSLVGQNRWQPLVSAIHGIIDTNRGVGGSKISKPDSGPTTISMCDDVRINSIPINSELVFFEGGTNDWAQSVPLGNFNSELDTEFYGALHITFKKLISRFPQIRIFCITSPYGERITVPGDWANGWTNNKGLTIRDYANAMREVSEFYGIPVIDWSKECGWNNLNISNYLDNDGAYFHPSSQVGAPQLAQIVIGRLWDIQKRT